MSEHAKEPWACETPCPGECCWHIVSADGARINYPEMSEKDARRIVACVNALEGLNDFALIGGWTFKGFTAYANKVERQRDELLAAIKVARECIAADRDSLYETHRNPQTQTVDDAFGLDGLADYDVVLDLIDAAIAKSEAA